MARYTGTYAQVTSLPTPQLFKKMLKKTLLMACLKQMPCITFYIASNYASQNLIKLVLNDAKPFKLFKSSCKPTTHDLSVQFPLGNIVLWDLEKKKLICLLTNSILAYALSV